MRYAIQAGVSSAFPKSKNIGRAECQSRTDEPSLEGWYVANYINPASSQEDLNPQPADYKSAALPVELREQLNLQHY